MQVAKYNIPTFPYLYKKFDSQFLPHVSFSIDLKLDQVSCNSAEYSAKQILDCLCEQFVLSKKRVSVKHFAFIRLELESGKVFLETAITDYRFVTENQVTDDYEAYSIISKWNFDIENYLFDYYLQYKEEFSYNIYRVEICISKSSCDYLNPLKTWK